MKPLLLVAALTLLASAADATCLKCDGSTGYRCFMSIYGTKLNCDSPSDAGCFTWGVCSGGSDCEFGCVLNIASVKITSPSPRTAKRAASQHLNG